MIPEHRKLRQEDLEFPDGLVHTETFSQTNRKGEGGKEGSREKRREGRDLEVWTMSH